MRNIKIGDLFCDIGAGALLVGQKPDGTLIHIDDSVSGLACGCTCPGCGVKLVGKKGIVRTHHFAHSTEHGRPCMSPGETLLHRMAKEALRQHGMVRLPEIAARNHLTSVIVAEEELFTFDEAFLEKRQGKVIPDVICRKEERDVFIEVEVTHPCDDRKIAKLQSMDHEVVEIDLSSHRATPLDEIGTLVTVTADRFWIRSKRLDQAVAQLAAETKRIQTERARQEIEHRKSTTARLVKNILLHSRDSEKAEFDFHAWFDARIAELGIDDLAAFRLPYVWQRFINPVVRLERALFGNAIDASDCCGLPIREEMRRRGWIRKGNAQQQLLEKQKRVRSSSLLDEIELQAAKLRRDTLVREALRRSPQDGKDWLTRRNQNLSGLCPLDAASHSDGRLDDALELLRTSFPEKATTMDLFG